MEEAGGEAEQRLTGGVEENGHGATLLSASPPDGARREETNEGRGIRLRVSLWQREGNETRARRCSLSLSTSTHRGRRGSSRALPSDVRVCEWRCEVVNKENGDRAMVGLGLTVGRGWALG